MTDSNNDRNVIIGNNRIDERSLFNPKIPVRFNPFELTSDLISKYEAEWKDIADLNLRTILILKATN
jgi:hypothetical protein